MNYFTSDIHLSSTPRLKLENRPFKVNKKFDNYIVKLWNSITNKNDTIYVIGDFVTCKNKEDNSWQISLPYAKKFKAKIVLILGNNEERIIKYFFKRCFKNFREYCLNCGFEEVYKNYNFSIKGINFFLTHRPSDCKKNMLNLFGHIHRAGGLYRPFGINIGCDLNRYIPYSEDDILFLLSEKQNYWDSDLDINVWE